MGFLDVTHSLKLEVVLNFVTNLFVLLIDHINVGVESVDVVEKGVVLLLSLNKSGHDFLNWADAGWLFNLAEGVHNNFDITSIHGHQMALFFILGLPPHKTGLHQSYGVCEFLRCGAVLNLNAFGLGLIELAVVTFLKLLLQVKNFVLERELVNLVLSFQGQDLIVCVLAEALAIVSIRIKLLDVVNIPANFTTIYFIYTLLVVQSLTPCIDILPQRFVLWLKFVKLCQSLFASVL
jgi:hypothetical protein